ELRIADETKTIAEGASTPWRRGTKRMQAYYRQLQGALVKHFQINEDVPFADLPDEFKNALYFGTNGTPIEMNLGGNGEKKRPFEGLVPQMQRLYEQTQSEFTRNRIRAFMTREPCKTCGGARLKPEILAVTIKDRQGRELNIHRFSEQTTEAAARYIHNLELTAAQKKVVADVVREIQLRLQFLVEVGLGYLTLDRESGTLSGGEAQRIRLATQIGSGLAGVLYVLDEPSIGLHQRDNARLLGTLRRLRDLGNSVIVVEHDEEGWLILKGATENNLKNIEVAFPLGCFTCVTGVSGSGKSTLVDDILRRALFRRFYNSKEKPGTYRALRGVEQIDKAIVIDQS